MLVVIPLKKNFFPYLMAIQLYLKFLVKMRLVMKLSEIIFIVFRNQVGVGDPGLGEGGGINIGARIPPPPSWQ